MEEYREITEEVERDVLRAFQEASVDTRWRPGQSGNPAGRPKEPDDATLTEWLIHVLGKKGAKELAENLIAIAKSPGVSPTKLAAIQYIYDRIEGKPRQAVHTTSHDEHPLITVIRKVADDNKALEGRRVPSLPARAIYEALDREGDSADA